MYLKHHYVLHPYVHINKNTILNFILGYSMCILTVMCFRWTFFNGIWLNMLPSLHHNTNSAFNECLEVKLENTTTPSLLFFLHTSINTKMFSQEIHVWCKCYLYLFLNPHKNGNRNSYHSDSQTVTELWSHFELVFAKWPKNAFFLGSSSHAVVSNETDV